MMNHFRLLAGAFALLTTTLLPLARAAQTDLSSSPLASTTSAQVKPNIMLLMDTSGSMGWGHMPDEVESITAPTSVGYKSAQCNLLYFNPATNYLLPKKPDGSLFPAPSITAAPYAGYVSYYATSDATDQQVRDLTTTGFQAYDAKTLRNGGTPDTPQPGYYYTYAGPQTLGYATAPCTDLDTGVTRAATGGGTWTRHDIRLSTPVEQANFAVWYSYYRIRISLTKSAASLAFTPLTDTFRVGFLTVQPKDSPTDTSINPAKYLAINDFNSVQRNSWFAKLFSQVPGGASPAREGLARVGRMYAGKHDGINGGMADDPVQYSCQQNFTIMTTDGYWNAQTESPGGGPVKIDGTTLVGQQDGTLVPPTVDPNTLTPRPIWDGTTDGIGRTDLYSNAYSYGACGSFAFRRTSQQLQSVSQVFRSTSQVTRLSAQVLTYTSRNLKSTNQILQSTSQTTQSTSQNLQSTAQALQSTSQLLKSTSQSTATTRQPTRTVTYLQQTTTQILRSTAQTTQSTTQTTSSTSQLLKSTNQNRQNTSQILQSTTQTLQTTTQQTQSTSQTKVSTSQITITTSQTQQSTSQTRACDARTELCNYVAGSTCTPSTYVRCETTTTGPTLVASCSPQTASASNNYQTVTCNTTTNGPVGTASCTQGSASSSNSYTTTTCGSVTTAPTATVSCTPTTASAGNQYTTTTCDTTTTGPTGVSTCTPVAASASNSYTATTCGNNNTNVPVASCTAASPTAANGYTTTACFGNNTSNVPVQSCTAAPPNAANSYTTTTCGSNVATDTPVATCTAASPSASNAWTTVTCSTSVTTTDVPSASCTAATAGSGNNFTSTTCRTATTPAVGVASCTNVSASSANNYVATVCGANNTTNVPVSPLIGCTQSGPSSSNGYTNTTCGSNNTTNVPVASCSAASASASNSWTTTTCPTANTTSNRVASCTASAATAANSWTATTCATQTVSPTTVVASCTSDPPTAANNFQNTVCGTTGSTAASGNCVATSPTAANNYTTTTCGNTVTTDVPSQTCVALPGAAFNNWTTTTCRTATTTNVAVQTCSASAASAANRWTATTCTTNNTNAVPVASCAAVAATAANGWTTTSCTTNSSLPVGVSNCTPGSPNAGNGFTTTTCNPVTTTDVPTAACIAAGPSVANGYTTTTCRAAVTTDVPSASCTADTSLTVANQFTATTCRLDQSTPTPTDPSCTPIAASAANGFVATRCSVTVPVPVTPVALCVPIAATAANLYVAITCGTSVSGPTAVASCTPSGPDSTNNYTTTTCDTSANAVDQPSAACSAQTGSSSNSWKTIACRTATTGPDTLPAASCVAAPATSANAYTATTCTAATGKKLQYTTTHTVANQAYSGGIAVGAVSYPQPQPAAGVATDVDGSCFPPGTEPPTPVAPSPEPGLPPLPAGCPSWRVGCTALSSVAGAGSVNSLADVAQYYYATDLRPASTWPASISTNNVPAVGSGPEDDRATWQHMTTFTIGLGVSGSLKYRTDYLSATTGDFASIRTGVATTNADGSSTAIAWPLWPNPSYDYSNFDNYNSPLSIDDFWHTAVNGRGKYFSAGDPTSVIAGLSGSLVGVQARLSSGAAAGISTAQPVSGGDNRVYVGLYTTSDWTGDVQARDTDLTTGLPSTQFWSAQTLLDARTGAACDSRNIYLMHGGSTLVNFSAGGIVRCDGSVDTSTGLDAGELGNFTQANAQLLSQWPSMSIAQQAVTPGLNLVNFLRGQRGFEGFAAGDVTKLYRTRRHVLGDVVDAQPVIVKDPSFGYSDAGYGQFAIDHTGRAPMVYVAANDGMLHAFYAGATLTDAQGGQEAWAVIPSTVLPSLYRLADDNYRNVHQFSVDGTPVVADARGTSGTSVGWRTILVAGLNAGGKGYYALDVTDPSTPRALWEFKGGGTCHAASEVGYTSDCYLGYSFGKPVVTKLANGTWVVMFTSGYNNVGGGSGDGLGYLYVVDAMSGAVISRTATGAGSAATPSGLAQINNYVENGAVDNTTLHVYGGDLLGNIWRFDLNGTPTVTLIGTAKDRNSVPQSITVRPELAEVNGKPMVLVGTGRLLGPSDIANLQVQSVYGIVDELTGNPVYSDLRGALAPLTMTLSADGQTRTIACTGSTTACGSANGWVADFPDNVGGNPSGERVNIQMNLASSTLVIGSNIPQNDACSTGGRSWLTSLDFQTGQAVTGSGTAVVSTVASTDSLLGGFNVIRLPSGNFQANSELAGRNSVLTGNGGGGGGGAVPCVSQPGEVNCQVPVRQASPPTKRISWREILQ